MDEETPISLHTQEESPCVAHLTTLQKAEYLKGVNIFSQTPVEELFILAAVTRQIILAPAQVVYRENDIGEALYILLKGEVELRAREGGVLEVIGPGRSFGVASTLTRGPRTSAAQALGEAVVLCLGAEDLFRAISQHSEIVASICRPLVQMAGVGNR